MQAPDPFGGDADPAILRGSDGVSSSGSDRDPDNAGATQALSHSQAEAALHAQGTPLLSRGGVVPSGSRRQSLADQRSTKRTGSSTFLTAKTESDSDDDNGVDLLHDGEMPSGYRSEVSTAETVVAAGTPGAGTAYQFTRRFRYVAPSHGRESVRSAGRRAGGASAPDGAGDAADAGYEAPGETMRKISVAPSARPESAGGERDADDMFEHPLARIVAGATQGMLETLATSHRMAPTFTEIDFADLLDRVLQRLSLIPRPDQGSGSTSHAQAPAPASPEPVGGRSASAPDAPTSTPAVHADSVASNPGNEGQGHKISHETIVQGLEIKIKIQNQIISEFGRRFDKLQKHNTELIEHNRSLVRERDVAAQTRTDLFRLLQEANARLQAAESSSGADTDANDGCQASIQSEAAVDGDAANQSNANSKPASGTLLRKGRAQGKQTVQFVEREYFDQEAIISAALADLHAQMQESRTQKSSDESRKSATTEAGVDRVAAGAAPNEPEITPCGEFIMPQFYDRIDKEIAKCTADLLSIKKHYDPPTAVGIGLKHKADSEDLLKTNPYSSVCRGKPAKAETTVFHPKRLEQLVRKATDHVNALTGMMTRQTNDLLEAKTPEKYVQILHQQLNDITASLFECIDALAEEQNHARRWRAQCGVMAKRLNNIRVLFDQERIIRSKFYAKRQLCANALLQSAMAPRQSASQWAWMHDEAFLKMQMLYNAASAGAAGVQGAGGAGIPAAGGSGPALFDRDVLSRIAAAAASAAAAAAAATGVHDQMDAGARLSTAASLGPGSHFGTVPGGAFGTSAPGTAVALHAASPHFGHGSAGISRLGTGVHPDHIDGGAIGGITPLGTASGTFDVLAGAVDERSLPPLPRRVSTRETRQLPEKIEIFIPSLRGSFGVSRGTAGPHKAGSMNAGTMLASAAMPKSGGFQKRLESLRLI
ncbi:hypothetical protein HK105_206337 [Polyrhizophydium stewartii]|uniref:Uncharacterized protein n=1 Tax=Polyrhizophydium stewartii TaxID=2732419 RepID=A0ABR4N3M5_9FUNG